MEFKILAAFAAFRKGNNRPLLKLIDQGMVTSEHLKSLPKQDDTDKRTFKYMPLETMKSMVYEVLILIYEDHYQVTSESKPSIKKKYRQSVISNFAFCYFSGGKDVIKGSTAYESARRAIYRGIKYKGWKPLLK